MRKHTLCLVVALGISLAAVVSIGGCSASKNFEDIQIVFVPKLTGSAFFESANDGAQAFAARNGLSVTYSGYPEAIVEEQVNIIRQAVADRADAICISSLNATALDEELKTAMRAGVTVVTWDSDVSGDARSLMVSQGTPEQLGRMLVEMGVKSLRNRGVSPAEDAVQYVWHYSQSSVADQNSWYAAGEKYIKATYPRWVNVAPQSYYSQQNEGLAVAVGGRILETHPKIDLIICNDSTALPGQAQALQDRGLTAADITITGFSSPNAMREYCKAGVIERWGLWDCQVQGALGCYLAGYLAAGNSVKVGDRIDVPEIGLVEVMPNTVLDPNAYTAPNSGVVLLPQRTEFTLENIDNYDF